MASQGPSSRPLQELECDGRFAFFLDCRVRGDGGVGSSRLTYGTGRRSRVRPDHSGLQGSEGKRDPRGHPGTRRPDRSSRWRIHPDTSPGVLRARVPPPNAPTAPDVHCPLASAPDFLPGVPCARRSVAERRHSPSRHDPSRPLAPPASPRRAWNALIWHSAPPSPRPEVSGQSREEDSGARADAERWGTGAWAASPLCKRTHTAPRTRARRAVRTPDARHSLSGCPTLLDDHERHSV
jgi:hypothetical protein